MATGLEPLYANPKVHAIAISFAKDRLVPLFSKLYGLQRDRSRAEDEAKKYSEALTQRVGFAKTFLHPERPQHIQRYYQPTIFENGDRAPVKDNLISIFGVGTCVAIVGQAGTGKSTTLKHLCYQCIAESDSLPVFIELRRLVSTADDGRRKSLKIDESIAEMILGDKALARSDQLKHLLTSAKLAVFLDGFDELPNLHKATYANEILQLTETYQNTRWIVTTRPEDYVTNLRTVSVIRPRRLSLEDACRHVDRYDFDEELQHDFNSLLKRGLYKEHEEFAGTPLLLAVLFLTYRRHRRISEQPHIFLEDVYEALCERHDSRKEGFERELVSGLTRNQFDEAVQLFSYISAVEERLIFRPADLARLLRDIGKALNVEVAPDKLRDDLVQSISFLVEDGNEYMILYKYLQEFLAARYLSGIEDEDQVQALAGISKSPIGSMSLQVMFAMNRDMVEDGFMKPLIRNSLKVLRTLGADSTEGYIKFLHRQQRSLPMRVLASLPEHWQGSITMQSVVQLLSLYYPNAKLTKAEGTQTWWRAEGTTIRDEDVLLSRGLEFFGMNGHFGSAHSTVGFCYPNVEELEVLLNSIQVEQEERQQSKRRQRTLRHRALRGSR